MPILFHQFVHKLISSFLLFKQHNYAIFISSKGSYAREIRSVGINFVHARRLGGSRQKKPHLHGSFMISHFALFRISDFGQLQLVSSSKSNVRELSKFTQRYFVMFWRFREPLKLKWFSFQYIYFSPRLYLHPSKYIF